MSGAAAIPNRPHREPRHGGGHPERAPDNGGIAPKHVITSYGFWIFLLSDIVMFSAFFA
ncbi:MAG: hypothetical protein JOY99_14780, partial [Sphingomonadaceae bacterium]|nr:hypothetical protein [Sphingomonadaceae bacterium]